MCQGRRSSGNLEQHKAARMRQGQSTLEYALVLFAFLSLVVGLAAVWHAGRDGHLLKLATAAASHLFGAGNTLNEVNDLVLF